MAFFGLILELGWVYLGPWPANLGGCTSGHLSVLPIFVHKTAIFGLRTRISLEIPGIFLEILGFSWKLLAMAGPGLLKTGLNLNLVVGGSLDVIESTSFSSKTGFPDPPRTLQTPPDPPRRVWK